MTCWSDYLFLDVNTGHQDTNVIATLDHASYKDCSAACFALEECGAWTWKILPGRLYACGLMGSGLWNTINTDPMQIFKEPLPGLFSISQWQQPCDAETNATLDPYLLSRVGASTIGDSDLFFDKEELEPGDIIDSIIQLLDTNVSDDQATNDTRPGEDAVDNYTILTGITVVENSPVLERQDDPDIQLGGCKDLCDREPDECIGFQWQHSVTDPYEYRIYCYLIRDCPGPDDWAKDLYLGDNEDLFAEQEIIIAGIGAIDYSYLTQSEGFDSLIQFAPSGVGLRDSNCDIPDIDLINNGWTGLSQMETTHIFEWLVLGSLCIVVLTFIGCTAHFIIRARRSTKTIRTIQTTDNEVIIARSDTPDGSERAAKGRSDNPFIVVSPVSRLQSVIRMESTH